MALPETIRKAEKEKAYIRRYGLKYNVNTDADIIAYLERQESMQGCIKRLIRADIAAQTAQAARPVSPTPAEHSRALTPDEARALLELAAGGMTLYEIIMPDGEARYTFLPPTDATESF